MSELKLPLSYLHGDHEYVLIDGNKHAIAHFLYGSELLRETREWQIEEIVKRVNAYQNLIAQHRDALTLLSGWIEVRCPARYRAEHRADLDHKIGLLRSLGEDA